MGAGWARAQLVIDTNNTAAWHWMLKRIADDGHRRTSGEKEDKEFISLNFKWWLLRAAKKFSAC